MEMGGPHSAQKSNQILQLVNALVGVNCIILALVDWASFAGDYTRVMVGFWVA